MNNPFILLILAAVIVLAAIFGLGALENAAAHKANAQANEARARGEARAMVIQAQAESRLHAATAFSITAGAVATNIAPYVLSGFGLIVLVIAIIVTRVPQNNGGQRPYQQPPRQVTERVIIMLPESYSRREMWDATQQAQIVARSVTSDQRSDTRRG